MAKVAILTGNTYAFRGKLKDHGWHWNADRKAWTHDIDADVSYWSEASLRHRLVNRIPGIGNRGNFTFVIEG